MMIDATYIRNDASEKFWGSFANRNDGGLIDLVWAEIKRAGDKHGWEQTPCNPAMSDSQRFIILAEEVGEVARALTYDEGNSDKLREELIQVAAMAMASLIGLR